MLDFRQPFMVLEPSCLMTGLLVPGPLDERESDRYSQSLPSHWCDDGHVIDPSLRCNINYLELFPVLIAARHWGPSWTNKRICVETDNTQAMVFINKGSCKNPIPMYWLWELFWLSVRHNFHLRERHLAGINNVMRSRATLLPREYWLWHHRSRSL